MAKKADGSPTLGVGLDVGTMTLIAARRLNDGKIEFNRIRDAFLDVEKEQRDMLKIRQTSFLELGNRVIILGDEAVNVASIFNREARRPMARGVISDDEDAQVVLRELLNNILGKPRCENEICYYSVPAEPIDEENKIAYHKKIFAKLIRDLGYKPIAKNEAYAICMSECANEGFSGISISFGAGMVNVCLTYATIPSPDLQFSVAQSGDWIDHFSAKAIKSTASRVLQVKEKGVNLMNAGEGDPRETRIREAVIFHYEQAIEDVLRQISARFVQFKDRINLPHPVPLVIAGGTSRPKGFLEFFKTVFGNIDDFSMPISEIRMASDLMNSVANGLLVCALNHTED